MSEELTDLVVLGRIIGKCGGWDQMDTASFIFYDFDPAEDYTGPVGETIAVLYDKGLIETYQEDGAVVGTEDLITAVKDCARG